MFHPLSQPRAPQVHLWQVCNPREITSPLPASIIPSCKMGTVIVTPSNGCGEEVTETREEPPHSGRSSLLLLLLCSQANILLDFHIAPHFPAVPPLQLLSALPGTGFPPRLCGQSLPASPTSPRIPQLPSLSRAALLPPGTGQSLTFASYNFLLHLFMAYLLH